MGKSLKTSRPLASKSYGQTLINTLRGRQQAEPEIEECIKSILEKLAKEQQKHLTERFTVFIYASLFT